jgi:hypothetical protein
MEREERGRETSSATTTISTTTTSTSTTANPICDPDGSTQNGDEGTRRGRRAGDERRRGGNREGEGSVRVCDSGDCLSMNEGSTHTRTPYILTRTHYQASCFHSS